MGFYPEWLFTKSVKGVVPPPPELPKYDPSIEAPKYNWERLWYTVDPVVPHPDIPKTGGQPDSDDKPDWRGVIKNNIIPLTPPERYKFGKYTPEGYFWFDTPDYADPFKKLKYSMYFMTKFGVMGTCVYAVMYNYDGDLKSMSYLARRVFGRFWLGGMTTSLAVVTLANLRGNVDDIWNYVVAGFIGGAVVGRNNHLSFLRQTFMFTNASWFIKWNAENNGKIVPVISPYVANHSMALGSGAEYGFWSGDFRHNFYKHHDYGRAVRTHVEG